LRVNPALMVRGESAGRNQAVYMGMQEQVLPPSVQDADEPNLGAEPLGVGRDFEHGRGTGSKEQVVQNPGVVLTEGVQLMRQCEYDVEVGDAEEFFFSCGEPALASLCLALWTVPVPA